MSENTVPSSPVEIPSRSPDLRGDYGRNYRFVDEKIVGTCGIWLLSDGSTVDTKFQVNVGGFVETRPLPLNIIHLPPQDLKEALNRTRALRKLSSEWLNPGDASWFENMRSALEELHWVSTDLVGSPIQKQFIRVDDPIASTILFFKEVGTKIGNAISGGRPAPTNWEADGVLRKFRCSHCQKFVWEPWADPAVTSEEGSASSSDSMSDPGSDEVIRVYHKDHAPPGTKLWVAGRDYVHIRNKFVEMVFVKMVRV